ncbi:MAG: hypothetical protein K9N23_06970 [Akkermansiaceae bacterium]|nr:hypothetical protein [Akkermansiaceae bacterium]
MIFRPSAITRLLMAISGLILSGCVGAEAPATASAFVKAPKAVRWQIPGVTEASGLASAGKAGDFLWLINDSGGGPLLHLTGTDGKSRGQIRIEFAKCLDWEDLAGFSWQGKPYLLIADAGDNEAARKSCTLYIVREPAMPRKGRVLTGSLKPEWAIEFSYPGGPRDCEAVAVDPARGKILLISKRTNPLEIYELPLRPTGRGLVMATRIGVTDVIPPPGGFPHPFGRQPTALDLSADGRMAAVLSYVSVFIFPRAPGESWAGAFARKPLILPRHGLPQAEAIAFSRDGKTLFVASEGAGTPVISYQLQEKP